MTVRLRLVACRKGTSYVPTRRASNPNITAYNHHLLIQQIQLNEAVVDLKCLDAQMDNVLTSVRLRKRCCQLIVRVRGKSTVEEAQCNALAPTKSVHPRSTALGLRTSHSVPSYFSAVMARSYACQSFLSANQHPAARQSVTLPCPRIWHCTEQTPASEKPFTHARMVPAELTASV